MKNNNHNKYDVAVIGGGFYGCAVALELSQIGKKVILLEKETDLMQRASFVNQARIHQGYHYPRSVLTALRSRVNFNRFIKEYESSVFSSFDKYYAIGKKSSKINADQFRTFCSRIGAPIEKADKKIIELFDADRIEDVFKVREYAFDAKILKNIMRDLLEKAKVDIYLESQVTKILYDKNNCNVHLKATGKDDCINTDFLFNCTYSAINQILKDSDLPLIPLKHELTEMALVKVPVELQDLGITIMDGPFFSVMPFPARGLHSLSHVRYTPHYYWQDEINGSLIDAHQHFLHATPVSRHVHMIKDAQRYIPVMQDCEYQESLWEIKTVLPQSEVDDSRPILFRRCNELYNTYSIMGGKIDNIFDIREKLNMLFSTKQETL